MKTNELLRAGRRYPGRIAVIAVLVAGIATFGAAANPLDSSHADGTGGDATARAGADAGLSTSLSIFRGEETSREAVPADVKQRLAAALPPHGGGDATLARRAQTTSTGDAVFVMPAKDGVCLITASTSEGFCAPAQTVLAGQAIASDTCSPSLPRDIVEIAGILPDGASDPVVVLADGSRNSLDIGGNTYVARFARTGPLPKAVAWDTPEGGASGDRRAHSVRHRDARVRPLGRGAEPRARDRRTDGRSGT
jgi:hypothetical protein